MQSLIARGAVDRIEGVAATPAEVRYLERRRTVTPGAAVTRYLRKHPEISGWWDVRDDWPRGAYAAVFLTDDSPAQRARIKRLAAFPDFTRVVKVRYSDRQRERLEVTEFPDFVAVGVAVRYSVYGAGFGDPGGAAAAKLKAPLGNRAVYDAYDGRRLIQTGPSPGDPPCPEPDIPEPTPLERAIAERDDYGMNIDPAYVQSLLDTGKTYTEDEQAWLDRYRDISYESKVDDYLQHWREDWGGNSVYAQYPNPPIVVIRFLRRLALHTERVKALAKTLTRSARSARPSSVTSSTSCRTRSATRRAPTAASGTATAAPLLRRPQ